MEEFGLGVRFRMDVREFSRHLSEVQRIVIREWLRDHGINSARVFKFEIGETQIIVHQYKEDEFGRKYIESDISGKILPATEVKVIPL